MERNNDVSIRVKLPREVNEQLHAHCSHAGIKRNALIVRLIESHLRKETTHSGVSFDPNVPL